MENENRPTMAIKKIKIENPYQGMPEGKQIKNPAEKAAQNPRIMRFK